MEKFLEMGLKNDLKQNLALKRSKINSLSFPYYFKTSARLT